MKKLAALTLLVASLHLAGALPAQEPVPLGDEFQINSYTTSYQWDPSLATGASGDFVVVWRSNGSSGTDNMGTSIQAQRFNANGGEVGGQFQVNTYSPGAQQEPSIAMDSDGNYVVVWQSSPTSGTDWTILGQRFDSAGGRVGTEFQVNTSTTWNQLFPSVAASTDGGFIVVWQSGFSGANDTLSILGQRFDSAGGRVGSQFQVNTYTTSYQVRPAVAVSPGGNFVVVWDSLGSSNTDTSSYSIQGQRYDANGSPIGGEFQINTYTTDSQTYAQVAADPQGKFVVVWDSNGSYGTDTSPRSIQGQRYDASGSPVGGEFQINTYTTYGQVKPAVAVDGRGSIVVAWHSWGGNGTDNSYWSVHAQLFNAAGSPAGPQFQVNTYTAWHQVFPTVAMKMDGDFIVAWRSYGSFGSDNDSWSIQGQRYSIGAIFTDGFESGDTSAWSNSIP